jgi:hypothetical protein
MGALTEVEIFDCLATNFKLAAELADDLAKLPLKGISYDKFRKTLRLIEGACKQASTWREDSRWLSQIGFAMGECHQRAGNWLRGAKLEDGSKVKMSDPQTYEFFRKMAEGLRGLAILAERLKNERTGRMGMILPRPLPGPHRDTIPVGFRTPPRVTSGGIILPDGVGLH